MTVGFRVKQTEAEFQDQVIQLARLFGWRCCHFRPAMNRRGSWSTPVQADGKGFLDLVLVRGRVVWAELKTDDGRLGADQENWMSSLRAAGQEVYLWRPRDWKEIEDTLR